SRPTVDTHSRCARRRGCPCSRSRGKARRDGFPLSGSCPGGTRSPREAHAPARKALTCHAEVVIPISEERTRSRRSHRARCGGGSPGHRLGRLSGRRSRPCAVRAQRPEAPAAGACYPGCVLEKLLASIRFWRAREHERELEEAMELEEVRQEHDPSLDFVRSYQSGFHDLEERRE